MERTEHQEPARLSIRRSFSVAPEKVWRAWTDPKALSQWFGPDNPSRVTTAEVELCVGGRYRIAFGTRDGEAHEVSGVYQEVVPHRRLVFTWAWHSTPDRVSRVSIDLKPLSEGTEFVFVHDRFFDDQARISHERGWQPCFDSLDAFLHATVLEA